MLLFRCFITELLQVLCVNQHHCFMDDAFMLPLPLLNSIKDMSTVESLRSKVHMVVSGPDFIPDNNNSRRSSNTASCTRSAQVAWKDMLGMARNLFPELHFVRYAIIMIYQYVLLVGWFFVLGCCCSCCCCCCCDTSPLHISRWAASISREVALDDDIISNLVGVSAGGVTSKEASPITSEEGAEEGADTVPSWHTSPKLQRVDIVLDIPVCS